VYRIAQEALTNIVKHANARVANVAITASAGTVSIDERDDGVGFAAQVRGSGLGLAGGRERAHIASGSMRVDSGERGTRLTAELPTHTRRATDRSAFERAAS
jgi:signal transduction histidine kinase